MHYVDLRYGQPPKNLKACQTPGCAHPKGVHGSKGGKCIGHCTRTDCDCPGYQAPQEAAA
jgi:hypothetical protein